MPRRRDIYLKIENLPAYSPVAPDDAEHEHYRLDCMRNMGHEDGTIPQAEVDRRRIEAIVYREYLDAGYTILNTAPLVAADIHEPRAERRMPGALIYTEPGERLFIHVFNADDAPHSLHVHGLIYGIDSDGSWPFGVHRHVGAHDDRRSDEICPGHEWCYVYDVTEETIGAWPFHDHHMNIMESVNRGLFGGIVVRDPHCAKVDYEVPLFFHRLMGARRAGLFDSGPLNAGAPPFSVTFPGEGTFQYFCQFHPMQGTVRVTAAGALAASVSILDGPSRFEPPEVTIRPGGTVTWTHGGTQPHTVTDAGGAGLESLAFNGRTFVGNTPTIVAETGKQIRWYVFNLDLGMLWHNFHAHGQRWRVGTEIMDTRSLGPAESFVADTIVPPVILLPLKGQYAAGPYEQKSESAEEYAHPAATHEHSAGGSPTKKPKPECVRLRGDFLVHCHAEEHMMQGMTALVRAIQEVEVTDELKRALGFHLPLADGSDCPDVHHDRCRRAGEGTWERIPDSPIFIVHAAVLHTAKVLLWSGTAEVGLPLESRVWDPGTGTMTTQAYAEDLFCSGHAFLVDGRLCVMGGASTPGTGIRSAHIFDPVAESWTKVADMSQPRWYPTALTLVDGRILVVSGRGGITQEIYNPAANTWQTVAGANRDFTELYASVHLLSSGEVFYSRAGWAGASGTQTAYLRLTGPASGIWTDMGQQQFYDRQEGTAVLQIDATVSPPSARIMIIGGGVYGAATVRNPQSCEIIDVTRLVPPPTWTRGPDMNFARTNVNGVLLPDGTILVIGGQRAGKWNTDPQPVLQAEIFDPSTNTWTPTAAMAHPRQYHSIAVLLPDGRVLSAGGVDPSPGAPQRDQRSMEIFSPAYLSRGPRPVITASPANVAYGATFDVTTPDAGQIDSAVLLRPCSMTHHTDAGQRYIKLPIPSRDPGRVRVQAPADGNIAPPGYYMLFIVNAAGVPSIGSFMRIA